MNEREMIEFSNDFNECFYRYIYIRVSRERKKSSLPFEIVQ
jgi:hypothetical protein